MTSDKFTIVVRDEGPPNGRKRRKPETVATIEFPGYHQFTLKIDRAEGQGKQIHSNDTMIFDTRAKSEGKRAQKKKCLPSVYKVTMHDW